VHGNAFVSISIYVIVLRTEDADQGSAATTIHSVERGVVVNIVDIESLLALAHLNETQGSHKVLERQTCLTPSRAQAAIRRQ